MKDINQLIPDIYRMLEKDQWFTNDLSKEFSGEVGSRLVESFKPRDEVSSLRLSQMGVRCPCQLWHSVHTPMAAERLPPWVRIKFGYGHIIEALIIAMAKAAGHTVTGEQDEIILDGVKGHRDCVIDGAIVDVKSCSSLQFEKYKTKSVAQNDSFGYLDQLDGYVVGSALDPRVEVKDRGYILAVDKTLGHLCLYEHIAREESIRQRIRYFRDIVSLDRPPKCTCETEADGESGNVRLGTTASYNAFKYQCFPQLRTFLYAGGPRYLTKVVKRPMRTDRKTPIPEIDRYGNFVYT
jgi:hypothetical protein